MMTMMTPKKMKVTDLRAELERRKLSSVGLKADLVQRLELALDEEEFGTADAHDMVRPRNEEARSEAQVTSKQAVKKLEGSIPAPKDPKTQDDSENRKTPDPVEKTTNMTQEEKLKARANRFGIPLSETDKRMERAKRFDLPVKESLLNEDLEKKEKRAERFGIETKEVIEVKLKSRADRFGLNKEDDKKLERAKRFNMETKETLAEKKKQRADRFGLK